MAETQTNNIPNNEIWYTSTDGNVVTPRSTTGFGANIVTNTYTDGKYVISFDGDVTSIGDNAFSGKSILASITIPNKVTIIGNNCFYDCNSLESIDIPNSVTNIEYNAFMNCQSLTSITIPNSVTNIGKHAFYNCESLSSISVELSNSIYDSRGNCNAIIETVSNTLLYGCKSTQIPYGITSIEEYAFVGCTELKAITIPNSITNIGSNAFRECSSLSYITIPDGVTNIRRQTFYGCSNLTSIDIPNGISSIEYGAFSSCETLAMITFESKNPPIFGGTIFLDCPNINVIYVPYGSAAAYKTAENFTEYESKIFELPSTDKHKNFLDLTGLKTFWDNIKSTFISSANTQYLKLSTGSTKSVDIDSSKLAKGTSSDAGTKLATDGYLADKITENESEALTNDEILSLFNYL